MSGSQDFVALEDRYGAHNYHPLDVVIDRADGVWVWDVDGRRYLDALASYSAVNQGHAHPRILATLQEQAHRVTLTSRAFRNDQLGPFCRELADLCASDAVLPMNTGAEAIETALKAARRWGYRDKGIPRDRAEIVVLENNFHGRTTTIVGFSSDEAYRADFGPFTPGFVSIPYGDLEALARALGPHTCALLIEPIQAEAGVIVPPDGYLAGAATLCRERNVLFIADEVQTGLGRTGAMFACDHEGVKPDLYVLGKALSGGYYPVSAVVGRRDIIELFEPGSHGSTYGGNPLACAVARTALSVIVEEKLPERAAKLGPPFIERLRQIRSPRVREVRGRGLLVGIELSVAARPVCEALARRGVLCKDTHDNTLRLTPPLVIDEATLGWLGDQVDAVLTSAL
ncbi:MAG: ornithine--oxo-acid transaminase [Candidatus Eremiobacteraeota bacterium]|nr:ornithine--oxo-acid transaminase [Candidatus Eremiobacteraeota bacterium]MBC5802444.1 ornithine--oxo-acid transaminase [Candidatus Eremiobacteraeota bacterium]MBC5822897.1 ornithine--oxo-acid transaminase [Candidatus Eremiobacteraeota bacterium]